WRLTRKRPRSGRRSEISAELAVRYRSSAWAWRAGMTAPSMTLPSSGGSESGVTMPFTRIAGGKPATRNRSAAACAQSARSHVSRRSACSMYAQLYFGRPTSVAGSLNSHSEVAGMRRAAVVMIVAGVVAISGWVYAQSAQDRLVPFPAPGSVVTTPDIGVRVDGTERGRVIGTLMIRLKD